MWIDYTVLDDAKVLCQFVMEWSILRTLVEEAAAPKVQTVVLCNSYCVRVDGTKLSDWREDCSLNGRLHLLKGPVLFPFAESSGLINVQATRVDLPCVGDHCTMGG